MEMRSLLPDPSSGAGQLALEAISDIMDLSRIETQRVTVHVVESDAAERANVFRLISQLGYHCEIYSAVDELISYRPASGILVVHERTSDDLVARTLNQLQKVGLPLMVVGCARSPSTEMVVSAMNAGAQYYFELPFDLQTIGTALAKLAEKSRAQHQSHEVRLSARSKVQRLSPRERQVVAFMVEGHGNKSIARLLDLSPRTVEIHRSKAMSRLGAQNVSEAVRIWLIGSENP